MKTLNTLFFLWMAILFAPGFLQAQGSNEIPIEIFQALKAGNSKVLSEYFNNEVEMTILDNEQVYSKSQATLVIKTFFQQNPPTDFKLIHTGGKDNTRYAIGNLFISEAKYRVYILLKYNLNLPLIHQLRVEYEQ